MRGENRVTAEERRRPASASTNRRAGASPALPSC